MSRFENTVFYKNMETVPLWSTPRKKHGTDWLKFSGFAEDLTSSYIDIDIDEYLHTHPCHLCDVDVSISYLDEHNKSDIHIMFKTIADTALERVKKQMGLIAQTARRPKASTYYCQSCSKAVAVSNRTAHENSSEHTHSMIKLKAVQTFLKNYNSNKLTDIPIKNAGRTEESKDKSTEKQQMITEESNRTEADENDKMIINDDNDSDDNQLIHVVESVTSVTKEKVVKSVNNNDGNSNEEPQMTIHSEERDTERIKKENKLNYFEFNSYHGDNNNSLNEDEVIIEDLKEIHTREGEKGFNHDEFVEENDSSYSVEKQSMKIFVEHHSKELQKTKNVENFEQICSTNLQKSCDQNDSDIIKKNKNGNKNTSGKQKNIKDCGEMSLAEFEGSDRNPNCKTNLEVYLSNIKILGVRKAIIRDDNINFLTKELYPEKSTNENIKDLITTVDKICEVNINKSKFPDSTIEDEHTSKKAQGKPEKLEGIIDNYCTLCDRFIPNTNKKVLKRHKYSITHRHKVWLAKADKMRWQIKSFSSKASCKICGVEISNTKVDINDHINSEGHGLNYKKMFEDNIMKCTDEFMIICGICNTTFSITDSIGHSKCKKHLKNMFAKGLGPGVVKRDHIIIKYKKPTEPVTINTPLMHIFEMTTDPYFIKCKYCDTTIPYSKDNMSRHFKSSAHNKLVNAIFAENKMIRKGGKQCYCEICDETMKTRDEFEHVKSKAHIQKLYSLPDMDTPLVENASVVSTFRDENDVDDESFTTNSPLQDSDSMTSPITFQEDKSDLLSFKTAATDISDLENDDFEDIIDFGVLFENKITMVFDVSTEKEDYEKEFIDPQNIKLTEKDDTIFVVNDAKAIENGGTLNMVFDTTLDNRTKLGDHNASTEKEFYESQIIQLTDRNNRIFFVEYEKSSKNDATDAADESQDVERAEEMTAAIEDHESIDNNLKTINEKIEIKDTFEIDGNSGHMCSIDYILQPTENSKEVVCKLCQFKFNNRADIVLEHLDSVQHMFKYHSYLISQKLKEMYEDFVCVVCSVDIDKQQLFTHLISKEHCFNLIATPEKKQETLNIPHVKEQLKQFEQLCITKQRIIVHSHRQHLMEELSDAELYCKLCDCRFTNTSHHLKDHILTDVHLRKYNVFLKESRIKQNHEKTYCEVCQTDVPDVAELDHVYSKRHANKNRSIPTKVKEQKMRFIKLYFNCSLCEIKVECEPNSMKIHNGTDIHKENLLKTKSRTVYKCDVCNVEIPNTKSHIRLHLKEAKHKSNVLLRNRSNSKINSLFVVKVEENKNMSKSVQLQSIPAITKDQGVKTFDSIFCNTTFNGNPNSTIAHCDSKLQKDYCEMLEHELEKETQASTSDAKANFATNSQNETAHLERTSHKINFSLHNKDSPEYKEILTSGNCNVCETKVHINPFNIIEHFESPSHIKNVTQNVDKKANDNLATSSGKNLANEINIATSKIAVGSNNVINAPNAPEIIKYTPDYMKLVAMGYCEVSETKVLINSHYLTEHLEGRTHQYNLSLNDKVTTECEELMTIGYCIACRTDIPMNSHNVTEHLRGTLHKNHITQNIEKKIDDNLATSIPNAIVRGINQISSNTFEVSSGCNIVDIPNAPENNKCTSDFKKMIATGICEVCKTKVPTNSHNVTEHLEGSTHKNNLLLHYKDSPEYQELISSGYCNVCKTTVPKNFDNVMKHLRGTLHKNHIMQNVEKKIDNNLASATPNVKKSVTNQISSNTSKVSIGYNVVDTQNTPENNKCTSDFKKLIATGYCKMCKTKVPMNSHNVTEHLEGTTHKNNLSLHYKDSTEYMELITSGYCNVCKTKIPMNSHNVKEHLRGTLHRNNIKQNVDKKIEDNLATTTSYAKNGVTNQTSSNTSKLSIGNNNNIVDSPNAPENNKCSSDFKKLIATGYCEVCKTKVPLNPHKVTEHLEGTTHKNKLSLHYKDSPEYQELITRGYCNVCKTKVPTNTHHVTVHLRGTLHRNYITQNAEKKINDNLATSSANNSVTNKINTYASKESTSRQAKRRKVKNKVMQEKNLLTINYPGTSQITETEKRVLPLNDKYNCSGGSKVQIADVTGKSKMASNVYLNTDVTNRDTYINNNIRSSNKGYFVCHICEVEVPNTESNIEDHLDGSKHKKKLKSYFQVNNVVTALEVKSFNTTAAHKSSTLKITEEMSPITTSTAETSVPTNIVKDNYIETSRIMKDKSSKAYETDENKPNKVDENNPIETEEKISDTIITKTARLTDNIIGTFGRNIKQILRDIKERQQNSAIKQYNPNDIYETGADSKQSNSKVVKEKQPDINTEPLERNNGIKLDITIDHTNKPVQSRCSTGLRHLNNLQHLNKENESLDSNEPYFCKICNMETENKTINIKTHLESELHSKMFKLILTKNKMQIKDQVCYCELCDLYFNKDSFLKHIEREKHLSLLF